MRIAVCDDEKLIRDTIAERIKKLYPFYEILKYKNGEKLLEDTIESDIVFLDIQMDGMDGIETAKCLRKRNKKIILIFLTAWEEYVFQAFDVEAFHYLIKPLRKEKFYQVLEAAINKVEEIQGAMQKKREEKSILVKVGTSSQKIYLDEIIYAEIYNRKVTLYTTTKNIEFYAKMSNLEQELGEDFVRPHRSYLVHLRYVSKYCATDITLENGTVILLAKQKYKEFVKRYMKYIKRIEEQV
ncbi:MAG: LytTR family DNA-binding domain-containing protein [Lachnospiraceae bacterium]